MEDVRKKWKKVQWDNEITYKTFLTYSVLFVLVTISIYLLFWLEVIHLFGLMMVLTNTIRF